MTTDYSKDFNFITDRLAIGCLASRSTPGFVAVVSVVTVERSRDPDRLPSSSPICVDMRDAQFREVARKTDLYTTISVDCKTDRNDHGVTRSHTMHKDAALIAHHHHTALLTALVIVAALTLLGCHGGVDVAVVGIPDGATVSVDSLSQDIAASPSKVYRYKGVGYAHLLGLAAAPSYTATARRLDGCAVAVGSTDFNGEDELRIDLHAVDNCDKTTTPQPEALALVKAKRPQVAPADVFKEAIDRWLGPNKLATTGPRQ